MPDQDSKEEKDIDTTVSKQGENDRGFSLLIKTEKPKCKIYFLLYLFG